MLTENKPFLSPRQELFCQQFILPGATATSAMIKAGYSDKFAVNNTSHLLGLTRIKARIQQLRDLSASKVILTLKQRQEILSEIASGKVTDFIRDNKVELKSSSALREVSVKTDFEGNVSHRIQLNDPTKAIDLLCKIDGTYTDTGNVYVEKMLVTSKDSLKDLLDTMRLRLKGGEDAVQE